MIKKDYSAGAVKFAFWFMEFRQMIGLLNEGKSFKEIKELNEHKMVAGIELVKKYKGATYKVRVVNGGFMMDGEVYKSLGAVARTITGRKISGQAFFGV